MQLRYNYRLYPDAVQREALARAFGVRARGVQRRAARTAAGAGQRREIRLGR
ncbi:helix-turn-helix domain-containing protein [Micromonospora sp. ATA32]|nr:helix-turn-helix domain-containing protein [Micromonospora sp. ATA32]